MCRAKTSAAEPGLYEIWLGIGESLLIIKAMVSGSVGDGNHEVFQVEEL